ncbi:hypothetical protein HYU11_04730 [Candidatus Woesearchaeota archaeon]|nr:hypothetical protein [Candidatus Woesearchaeota archaeon]
MRTSKAIAFILILAMLTTAASASYRIYGKASYNSAPLPDIAVTALNTQTEYLNKTATGADGHYSMQITASEGDTILIRSYNTTILARAGNGDIRADIRLPRNGATGMVVFSQSYDIPITRTGILLSTLAVIGIATTVFFIKAGQIKRKR